MDNTTTKNMDSDLSDGSYVKTCVDCGTSKTPLWRGGPAGPKSLCNACGIRSRKKRRDVLGLNKISSSSSSSSSTEEERKKKRKKTASIKSRKLLALGSDVSWKRSRSSTAAVEKLRRKLGEAEQAAVLLMALSCGSVYG